MPDHTLSLITAFTLLLTAAASAHPSSLEHTHEPGLLASLLQSLMSVAPAVVTLLALAAFAIVAFASLTRKIRRRRSI